MQYYIFNEACATKDTGPVFPQVQKWKPEYDDDKADSYYAYYYASSKGIFFPDFVPDMDALVMHGWAKPTDLVSSCLSIGFIVSQRLKVLFDQYKFPPNRFYITKIIHKKMELDGYYFIHIVSNYFLDYLGTVNYQKSVFIITGNFGNNPQTIILKSKDDYLEKSKQLQEETLKSKSFRTIHATKIYFNSEFDKSLDCFAAPFGINYYISENLKDALVKNNITGCDIQPTDMISITS